MATVVATVARAEDADRAQPMVPVSEPEPASASDANDVGPIADARQLFALLGVDEAVFGKFVDGQPMDEGQLEPLADVLFQLSKFPPTKVDRWARRDVDSQQLASNPAAYRGQLVQLAGRVKRVAAQELSAELAERFEMPRIFAYRIELSDGGRATVFARQIPAAWKLDEAIDEEAEFQGVLLNVGPPGRAGRPPELFFAARRVAWFPSTPLGSLGMDFGLLDHLQQNQPISAGEADAFYQMLQAAGRTKLSELLAATRGQRWTLIPSSPDQDRLVAELQRDNAGLQCLLMSAPQQYAGQLMVFQGRLHRCIPVRVTDRELAERLGFDTYYELAIFIDLGYRQRLLVPSGQETAGATESADTAKADDAHENRTAGDATARPKEVDTYPVFACVLRLPPGFPTGEKLNEGVRVPGFFFKQWAYHSQFAAPAGQQRLEFSPLLIGPGVEWLTQPRPADSRVGMIAAGALVVALAVMFVALWITRRRDQQFRRAVLERKLDLATDPLSNEMEFDESAVRQQFQTDAEQANSS